MISIETFDRNSAHKEYTTDDIAKVSMEALQLLDSSINDTPADSYTAVWRNHYNVYWNNRVAADFSNHSEGDPPARMMEYIIYHYNSHRITDSNGFLKLYIPKPLLYDVRLKIEIGFHDFPVVTERLTADNRTQTLLRDSETPDADNGTGFSVTWQGVQDTAWGSNFGWMLRNGEDSSELKVSESLVIKNDENKFTLFDTNLLSSFYETGNPHFVLFAMQWCQPVWDRIDDDGSRSSVQDANYSNLNMHIVTMYCLVSGRSGKHYGTTRHRVRAIDLHTVTNESILFAVHAGNCTCNDTPAGDAGRTLIVAWSNRRLRYCHLASFNVATGTEIMCGRILGVAGNTGNFRPLAERTADNNNYQSDTLYPDHVHIDDGYGQNGTGILSNRNDVDDEYNRMCIPDYNYPHLYPCYCRVSLAAENPSNCNFNSRFANNCWAAEELRCPHMLDEGRRNRRIQAQLKFIEYYTGSIDGVWGPATQQAIRAFKLENDLTTTNRAPFAPEDSDMNEEDETRLNELAPINE